MEQDTFKQDSGVGLGAWIAILETYIEGMPSLAQPKPEFQNSKGLLKTNTHFINTHLNATVLNKILVNRWDTERKKMCC